MTDAAHQQRPGFVRAVLREPVALGLALMLFVRPWRDGITFPGWDAYFLWIALLLGVYWGIKMLLRGEPIRFPVLLGLFFAYVVIVLLTALNTFQIDATYRATLNLFCYFLVFALAANALRTRLAVGIVLAGLVASSLPNAIWAILHLKYTLTYMREIVTNDPSVLRAYGMSGDLSPDLQHRIETNRAFGTLLYPNALAAYLILVIPVAIGFLVPSWTEWRTAMATRAEWASRQSKLYLSAAVGLFAWFLATAAAFFLYPFLLLITTQDANWGARPLSMVFYLAAVPLVIGAVCIGLVRRNGLRGLRTTLQVLGLAGLAAVGPVSLWLTYSRGGFLAFAGAVAVTAVLFVAGRKGLRLPRGAAAAAALVLVAAVPLFAFDREAYAQQVSAQEDNPQQLNTGGRPQDVQALTDPSTFLLRLTYWQVGWRMFLDNPIAGVGLGNFGTAYSNYQHIGDGATQTAHNAYVKALAETGLFGFLAFCAFVGYFVVCGGLQVLNAPTATLRWQLGGLYCGVLAFWMHCVLDFNFANSALTTPAMALTGVFCALSRLDQPLPTEQSRLSKVLAIPLLALVALALGASMRVFFFDLAIVEGSLPRKLIHVGEMNDVRNRALAADYFFKTMPAQPRNEGQPIVERVTNIAPLIPNVDRIRTFGEIREPVPGQPGMYRRTSPEESLSENAVIVIRDPLAARAQAVEMSHIWLEAMENRDSLYPHVPEIAMILYEWYGYLQEHEPDPEKRKEYVAKMRHWAEEGVRRSPRQAWFHTYLGKAKLVQGTLEQGHDAVNLYHDALAAYRTGTELLPISDVVWEHCGTAMLKVGDAFVRSKMTEEGERLMREGREAKARARELRKAHAESGV